MRPRRKRRVVGSHFLRRQTLRTAGFDNFPNWKPGAVHGKGTPDFESKGNGIRPGGQAAIGQNDTVKPIGHFGRHAQADQGTPILAEQGHAVQLIRFDPSRHPLHMVQVRVVLWTDRLVRASKAHQVRRQHPKTRLHQHRNHLAVQK